MGDLFQYGIELYVWIESSVCLHSSSSDYIGNLVTTCDYVLSSIVIRTSI